MKNFKKLFGIIASMLMVLSLVPVNVLGSTYTSELEDSYDYGYEMGITTKSTIDSANMYGSLIRSHMSKMMSNYAVEVLGLIPDTSRDCSYSDISNETSELQDYMVEACELGLMGLNSDGTPASMFNPSGIVTRAQFGTVLSRALYGDMYNGGEPRYGGHLDALNADSVMMNISNPNATEVRGYVMLMMMRADEAGVATNEASICLDDITVALCAIGDSACPAECLVDEEPEEVLEGTINLSLNGSTLADGTQVPSTGTVRFAVVDFKASSSDVSLKTIELSKIGLASVPSATRVWFEKNGIRVSGRAAFSSEGVAILSFAPQYVVKAGSTETLDLYLTLATTAGQDFQFESTDVNSTAQYTNGGFTTPSLRTAAYTVAPVDLTGASADTSYNATLNGLELGAFTLSNNDLSSETRDVAFDSLTLRQAGNGSLSNLSDIILERNGVAVGSDPAINGRDMTFSIDDTIKDGVTATYYIKAIVTNVENNGGDTYQFDIRNTTDVNASEVTTAFRSTVTLGSLTTALSLSTYTVDGSDIAFSRDTAQALSANYAVGSDVVLMKGTITSNEAITLEDISLTFTGTYPGNDLSNMFSTIYLQVGSSTFSYSPTTGDLTGEFLGTTTIDGATTVKMYGRIRDTATAANVSFSDFNLAAVTTAEYSANGNTVTTAVGSIAGITVTAQTATLNVTKTDALGNTNIAAGTSDLTMYGLSLASTQGNGVTVSNIVVDVAGNTTGFLNNAYLTLYIDGVAQQSRTVTTTSVTFDGFSKQIAVGTPMDIVVKANLVEAFNTGTIQLTLATLNAYDTLTSATISSYAQPAGAIFTIGTALGTLAASNNNPLGTLLLSPSTDNQLVAFKLTATNDSVRLYDVALTGVNITGLSNFRLTAEDGSLIAVATTATSTGVTFAEIANAPSVTQDTSANYYVVADANSSTEGSAISLTVNNTGSTIKGSNGTTIAIAGGDVLSRTHAMAENTMTVAKATNTNKSLTTSALRFTVTAAGVNSITLTGADFTNALAGYTGDINLVVYKTSISSANEAGRIVWAAGAQTVLLTGSSNANSTVDAGSTVEYIVAFESALVDPVSNSTDWNATLSSLSFDGIAANTYNNIGALPMTEVK